MACRAALVAVLGLLLVAAVADARMSPAEAGRSLLQTPSCSRIGSCTACRNQRVGGATILQCTGCASTYKPSSDYLACQCAPGYFRANSTAACQECGAGSWCAGGDDELTQNSCGTGLTTLITTAARADQCVTLAGYGFDGTAAAVCDVASYSTGKTRNPCRACGAGLTTAATQSTSFADCVAPMGYYFDKNAAKPCPRGAYSDALGRNAACTPCAAGVTTAASASDNVNKCVYAKPGYAYVSQNSVSKCAKNFFQGAITQTTSCTACGANMVTLKAGATTNAACVALPGYEYSSANNNASACAAGSYKGGSNRRACVACGDGFTTTGTAKISFADCYIPQGWGTTKSGAAYVAAQCDAGFYGAAQSTFGVKSLPCTPCPAGMTAPAASNGPEDCVTVAGWGYDQLTATAAKCTYGFFSAGGARDECVSCGEGYTTATEASDASTDCVIAPGYGYKGVGADPEPCAKGFYGVGGAAVACAACSGQSTTTVDSLATSQADCDVCVAGYGGASCSVCAYNTFNQGDADSCTSCSAGLQAPAGSTTADSCLAAWTSLPPSVDSIAIDAAAAYVSTDAATSAADCKVACDAASTTCMFYTFDSTNTVCYLASKTAGSDSLAFKSATGTYTVWTWTASLSVGTTVGTPAAAASLAACTATCDAKDECVAAVFDGTTCTLKAGSTSPDFKSCQYRAVGSLMPAVSA